jgi:hypothetical protein
MHPEIRDSIRHDMTLQQLDYQMSPCEGLHDGSCSEEWVQRDPKDPSRNLALLACKKKPGCWSNSYLRFQWRLVKQSSGKNVAERDAEYFQRDGGAETRSLRSLNG